MKLRIALYEDTHLPYDDKFWQIRQIRGEHHYYGMVERSVLGTMVQTERRDEILLIGPSSRRVWWTESG